jgi:hypothetical protein
MVGYHETPARCVTGEDSKEENMLALRNTNCKVQAGRAIAQAVSRRLPTAAARVRFQVRSCGICDEQSGTGAGFLRVLRFPLPILISPTTPHSSVIRGWYNRPNIGGRTKWTRSHPPKETN